MYLLFSKVVRSQLLRKDVTSDSVKSRKSCIEIKINSLDRRGQDLADVDFQRIIAAGYCYEIRGSIETISSEWLWYISWRYATSVQRMPFCKGYRLLTAFQS